MTVITVELLTKSRINLGAEEFLTPVTAPYCTRIKESASAYILVGAMTIYITISCNCIIEIRKNYLIEKEFADGKLDECLDEMDIYFNERIEK